MGPEKIYMRRNPAVRGTMGGAVGICWRGKQKGLRG
jgi:hypothetical protein